VKAVWLGRREGEERISHRDKMVDSVMGVRRPTFKRTYNATRLNSNYLYNSITMMLVGHVISTLVTVLDHVTTMLRHDANVTTVLDHAVLGHVTVTRLTCYYLLQCSPSRTTPLKSYVCLPQK